MKYPRLFTTPISMFLVVPTPHFPLYVLYESNYVPGNEWEWRPYSWAGYHGAMVPWSRIEKVYGYQQERYGAANVRWMSRLEALIRYGYITE